MKQSVYILIILCLFASCAHKSKNEPDTSKQDENKKITLLQYVRYRPTNPPPPITPLDRGKTREVLFCTELQNDELLLTSLDSVGDVGIVVSGPDAVVYSATESFVGMDERISISTQGWEKGDYTLCITCGDISFVGSFSIGQ